MSVSDLTQIYTLLVFVELFKNAFTLLMTLEEKSEDMDI